MSSSRPSERVVYQDYIAKIRYSNQLPPPPNPPKLLDIPGTGLSGTKYTNAGYASRLVREQPLNIEADAELGMPIDLIGIPGVFNGDERAIQMDPHPRPLHPSDKLLLRPLAVLNKSGVSADQSSYLRRTEYTASSGPQMFASGSSKDLLRIQGDSRRKQQSNLDKEDPKNILQNVIKGFDIAYPHYAKKDSRSGTIRSEDVRAWSAPRHPTNQALELLDSYPLLPDIDALPETGSYVVCKFITNPVAATDRYDDRLDTAVLQPVADEATEADYHRRLAEWDEDSGEPRPLPEFDYDYFLPEAEAVQGIKRKLDTTDPDNEDDELYTEETADGQRMFKYNRVRRYEQYNQNGDEQNVWNDSVALALHDPDMDVARVSGMKKRLAKGAYFYPVSQRIGLRPQRKVGVALLGAQTDQDVIDELDITIRNLSEHEDDTYKLVQEVKARVDPALQLTESTAEALTA